MTDRPATLEELAEVILIEHNDKIWNTIGDVDLWRAEKAEREALWIN